MEGDHRQPPAPVQPGDGRLDHPVHTGQFIVDGDADGLKTPLGRMLLLFQGSGGHPAADNIHQLQGRLNGLVRPAADDRGGNGCGIALLAVLGQDAPQFLLAPPIHHIGSAQALVTVHAHIQGSVRHIGKAPGTVVQLRGGHPKIKEHPVHAVQSKLVQDPVQLVKIAVDQGHPVHPRSQPLLGGVQRRLVPIHTDQPPGGQPPGDLPAVSRPAQRSVQIDALRPDGQGLDTLVQQHRTMGKCLTHLRTPTHSYRPPSSPASFPPRPGTTTGRSRSPPGR